MCQRKLPVTRTGGMLPEGSVISACEFEAYLFQDRSRLQAAQQADAILVEARRRAAVLLHKTRRKCHQEKEKMRLQQATLQEEIMTRCEGKWREEHITQLRQDEALQQEMVRRVAVSIRRGIQNVLSAWFDQQDLDEVLCRRLARNVEKMAVEGALSLHIHPSVKARVQAEFGERFTLVEEPRFTPDRAALASAQLSVSFSLKDHFYKLLDWLDTPGECDEDIRHGCDSAR
ncbi:type III secretion system stator protein SctL [unidentified bacterial endosymbiont]|uniref:type III secretion system stator protein SctL n=1 Tax=unidentified bacterial endosymbiont TaxID=2355 RepID=UPI00209F8FF1|nr:type III secretion system stator protein SctL [unidentified bacterial endosymbiont]